MMAFPDQHPLPAPNIGGYLEPIRGSYRQSFDAWRLIRSNRSMLNGVLPGVVTNNHHPWQTYHNQQRLSERPDREGYIVRRARAASGIVTLLQKTLPNHGTGIQIDQWLDTRVSHYTSVSLAVAKLTLARAWEVIDELGLDGNPHAWLEADLSSDPSGELGKIMTPVGNQEILARDADTNAPEDKSYILYIAKKSH